MASILSWEKNAANTVKRDVQGAVAQVNPLDGGRTFQTVQQHGAQYAPQPQASAMQQLRPAARNIGTGIGLGAVRSLTGTGQAVSGLYDLATPGVGTNRISKGLDKFAKFTDQTAKAEGVKPSYKAGQLATDALQFAAPSAIAKAAGYVPKATKGLAIGEKAVSKLATKGLAGKATATVIRGAAAPSNLINAGVGTAQDIGQQASKGTKITPARIGTDVGTNLAFGTGLHVAGKAAGVITPKVTRGIKSAAGKQLQTVKDMAVGPKNPHPDLTPDDYMSLRRVTNHAQGGPEIDRPASQGDLVATRSILKQKGFDPNDLSAADHIVNQISGYEAKLQAVKAGTLPIGEIAGDVKDAAKKLAGGKQSTELASEAVPAKVPGEQASGIASGNSTPVDVRQYIKDQVSAQEASRKAGQPSGLGRLKTPLADAKTKLVDSLAPIEDTLNQKITNENATGHITPQLDRALRADTIAGQYMKDNGLSHVIQNVPNTKEFDQYLIAKHAKDLEANGVKTGRNLAADDQLVQSLSPTYEPHAQAIAKYSQDLLDKTADYGLISKELAAHLKEKYPNYVPANRIFGEGELPKPPKGTGAGKASIGTQSVVQKIKGSDRAIESPLSSIINKTQQVIDQGERNKAAQILTGYKDLPGNPFNLRELAKDETVGTKPVISVLDNGVKRQFETTPEIAAAAKSLNKEQLGLIGKILAVPTRVLRLGATGLNPAFAGANIIKDLASGAINSKNPLRSSVANPRVFLKALVAATNHNSPEYGELVREGAGGTSFDIARDAPVQNVKSIRAQKNVGTKIAYTVTHPAQLFRVAENTIGRSEEFSRALQYYGGKEASLAKNASPEAARVMGAHAARNNTVNFARGGDYTKVLNSVLPYLNAGVQGSRTLIRNAGDRPAQTAAKLAVLGFFPTAAVTAWNLSDPKRKAAYDDIKEYEKQGNLVIVPPNPKKDAGGKWNVIKIPVSQEIANLNNIVRNGIETGAKDGSMKIGDLAGNLVGTVSSLNAQSPRQLIGQAMPQAIKPVVESVVNQNLFTGNKIVPDSQKNLDPRDQYGNTTSGTARVLGGLSNLSPRHIDNAIRTATGGLGQNVVNLADKGLAAAGAIKPGDVKGKSFYDSISGRFAGAQGSGQYDAIDKQSAALTKQLKATPGYQAMNPQDKAKALNRLTNQVTQTFTSKKALSSKQQDIKNGKADINSYLKPSTGGNTTADYNKSPDAEYKAAQARFDTNKSSMNDVQKIKAQNNLNKLKIGSQYDKSIRDLYSASKATAYQYVSTNKDGKAIADKLQAYDQALYDAGLVSYKKYSNGIAPAAKKGGSGRGRSTASRRSVPGVKVGSLKAPRLKTIKVSSSFKTPKLSSPKMKSARKSIPKFATKTPKLNVTKGNA